MDTIAEDYWERYHRQPAITKWRKQIFIAAHDIEAFPLYCTVDEFIVIRIATHFNVTGGKHNGTTRNDIGERDVEWFLGISGAKFFDGFLVFYQDFRRGISIYFLLYDSLRFMVSGTTVS